MPPPRSGGWSPPGRPAGRAPLVLVPDGEMGAVAAREAGVDHRAVGPPTGPGPTSAADTRRLARALVDAGIDLLLVAGGDGTARDVCAAVGEDAPVLGIPAGVKILSGVFATSPAAAGELAAAFLAAGGGATVEGEVVDLDEDAYRRGIVAPRLFGHLRVPRGRRLQGRKSPSPPEAGAAAAAIAEDVVERMTTGRALGPRARVHGPGDRRSARRAEDARRRGRRGDRRGRPSCCRRRRRGGRPPARRPGGARRRSC